MKKTLISLAALFCCISCQDDIPTGQVAAQESTVIQVQLNKITGKIKPMHGIGNGPKFLYRDGKYLIDATEEYRTIGIPLIRLHDTEYPYGQDKFVDIHCVFPDANADTDQASSYHFKETDNYIANIKETGAQIIYRLGESIDHTGNKLYINPPKDYEKWAKICSHIIAHYNEGWNNGFHYGIKFWEIWNEPNHPNCWTGTMQQYYQLYQTAATYLKSRHPDIKIGCAGLTVTNGTTLPPLLEYMSEHNVPLDFLPIHHYSATPVDGQISFARRTLDKLGFAGTQIIEEEYNMLTSSWHDLAPTYKDIRSQQGGIFTVTHLVFLQNSQADYATYYSGDMIDYWTGLYTWPALFSKKLTLLPSYYAFHYFGNLYRLGNQASTQVGRKDVSATAATNGEETGILLINRSDKALELKVVITGLSPTPTDISIENICNKISRETGVLKNNILPVTLESNSFSYIKIQ